MSFDRRERVISASVEEFTRELQLAFPGAVAVQGNRLSIDACDARLEIEVEVLDPLVIALLRMPQLRARFTFTRGTPADRDRLFEHLDRATQRGGG